MSPLPYPWVSENSRALGWVKGKHGFCQCTFIKVCGQPSDMTSHRLMKRPLLIGFLMLLMNGLIFSIILSLQGKYGNRLSSAIGPFTTDGYKDLLSHYHSGFTADGHRERFRSLQEWQTCILHGPVSNGTFAETSYATFRSYSTEVSLVDQCSRITLSRHPGRATSCPGRVEKPWSL